MVWHQLLRIIDEIEWFAKEKKNVETEFPVILNNSFRLVQRETQLNLMASFVANQKKIPSKLW